MAILERLQRLCLTALLFLANNARADHDWLVLRGSRVCTADRDVLAERIDAALAGARNPALTVQIALDQGTPPTAIVGVAAGSQPIGVKRLQALTCAEALDAVVAVAALALSSARPDGTNTARAEPAPQVIATGRAREVRQVRRDDSRTVDPRAEAMRFGLLLGVGVDTGSLAQPTLMVVGGAALGLGRGELRAVGRYGVPSTTEEVSLGLERLRTQFGSAALDYCHGLDRARWLSLCGGFELSVQSELRVQQLEEEPRSARKEQKATFGPLAGLSFVFRALPVQPQLELSAQLPVVGRAPALGFRAAVGAGLPF